jgi:hypothetical protein
MRALGGWGLRKVFVTTFIVVELCLLAWWMFRLDGQYDNEDFLLFQVLLVAVGFPSALVALVLVSLVDLVIPIFAGHTRVGAFAIWLTLAVAAYVQWFVLVPPLFERARVWWQRRSES